MDIATSERGSVTIVSLRGTLAIGASDEKFRNKLGELFAAGKVRLVLDCSELRTMDSTGLNAFLFALTDSRSRGGALTLFGPNERVRSVFETTQLDSEFGLHTDLQEAVASVQSAS
jgi:anti-sigma B factor antagonist